MDRDVSGFELYEFLIGRGFRICASHEPDLDFLIMAKDCDDVLGTGYIGIPLRQTCLSEGYLTYTLKKAGFTWEYFWKTVGTTS